MTSGRIGQAARGSPRRGGGALVLRGPAGIGKTALLDWAVGRAADMHVTRVAGLESEVDLGFAGLHQVLVPFLARLEQLPPPQREALGAAFGLVEGVAPDRFLVGLVIRAQLATGGEIRRSAAVVASWARYAEGTDEQGQPIEVVDRLADRLIRAARRQCEDPLAFIADQDLFGELAGDQRFTAAYTRALASLHVRGARATLESLD